MAELRNIRAEQLYSEHLEWERLYSEFTQSNPGFPFITPSGVRLRLIPEGGKIRLAILVDELTNQADIASPETWKLVKEWRDRLANFQGPFSMPIIVEAMAKLNGEGKSYREIAKIINDDLAMAVRNLTAAPAKGEQDLRALDQAFLYEHLRFFRFKDEEIQRFILDGMARIAEGRAVFNPDTPIDETKVKSILQYRKTKYSPK